MKYIIYLKSICTAGLGVFGVLFFVYLFNMVIVVNDTKKINTEIEVVTSKLSEQTSKYYATQSSVEDSVEMSQGFMAPVSRTYVNIEEPEERAVVATTR